MQILILYFATALVFLGLDVIGLRLLIRPVFERHVGDLLVDGFRLVPALVFYLFYVAGLIWFVSLPALRAEAPAQAELALRELGQAGFGAVDATGRSEAAIIADALGAAPGPAQAALGGAFLGALAYGTYEFTNLATLKGWSWSMLLTDLSWGIFLTGFAAWAGLMITRALS